MNPFDCRVELRERSSGEVFDLTWRLLGIHLVAVSRLAAVWLLPWWLVTSALCQVSTEMGWTAAVGLVVLSPLLQAPFTLLGAALLFDRAPPLSELVSGVRRLAGRVALLLGLQVVLLLVGGLTASLLWWPAAWALCLLPETLLLEGTGIERAARRALLLSMWRTHRTVSGVLMISAVGAWTVLTSEMVGQWLVDTGLQLGRPFGSVAAGQVTPFLLAGILWGQPVISWLRLLLYVDVRTSQDGWDLQLAAQALSEAS